MHALVLYESMFGNTAAIGEEIAASLRSHGLEVESGPLAAVEPSRIAEADLLVVGAPTHAHGMSSKQTRKAAAEDKRYPSVEPSPGPGIRDWLNGLPPGMGRLAAAFDTRFDKPRFLTGSAAKGIARRLEQHGYRLVTGPESFFVTSDNRLADGQADHATRWGTALADAASAGATR
jgi:hypothetical protein